MIFCSVMKHKSDLIRIKQLFGPLCYTSTSVELLLLEKMFWQLPISDYKTLKIKKSIVNAYILVEKLLFDLIYNFFDCYMIVHS